MKLGLGGWFAAIAFAASVSLAAATSTANAQPAPRRNFQFQTVALSEWAAPGTEPGVTYGPTLFAPLLGEGQVLFFANSLSGAGVDNTNNQAFFAGPAGGVQLAARRGAQQTPTLHGVGVFFCAGAREYSFREGHATLLGRAAVGDRLPFAAVNRVAPPVVRTGTTAIIAPVPEVPTFETGCPRPLDPDRAGRHDLRGPGAAATRATPQDVPPL